MGKYALSCDLCHVKFETDLLILKRLGLCYNCARQVFPNTDLMAEAKKKKEAS